MQTILTVNSGSSSLKCGLYGIEEGRLQCLYHLKLANLRGDESRLQIMDERKNRRQKHVFDLRDIPQEQRHEAAFGHILDYVHDNLSDVELIAAGHRIVHGGSRFKQPIMLDDRILTQLKKYIPLAPLHQPFNLRLIEACLEKAPDMPQIGCFDTMFHANQPLLERLYAIPEKIIDNRVMKYGFHGLSYDYIQRQMIDLGRSHKRTIVCHLGAGASMCAIRDGQSIASSMGFTAVDGLPMGTRCGNIDPGVVLYMMRNNNLTVDEVEHILYSESGWLGISGVSSDMLELHNAKDGKAELAIDLFCYRAALEIGRLTAALHGLEQLVFTGGVGENDHDVRARIIARSRWLGLEIDAEANHQGRTVISPEDVDPKIFVIPTNEEAVIAEYAQEVLGL